MKNETKSRKSRTRADLVEEYILSNGKCSVLQLLGALGRTIPPNVAASRGRQVLDENRPHGKGAAPGPSGRGRKIRTAEQVVESGRKSALCNTCAVLCNQGRIRRVSLGVYAPPLGKLPQS